MKNYLLLDSGDQRKLEQFGPFVLSRPCAAALWKPSLKREIWAKADGSFSREETKSGWSYARKLPSEWVVEIEGIKCKISPTDFGHLGVFPEHSTLWESMQKELSSRKSPSVLNLFAYSGGATLAAAVAGAKVCHVDASQGMVAWARENAALNNLTTAPIRWIVDDVFKFLKREVKRGVTYDGILLDPPSFGRGSKQEVFKIERDLHELLDLCNQLLSNDPLFITLTTHTPGMTPLVMQQLLSQKMEKRRGKVLGREMSIPSQTGFSLPSGSVAEWRANG